MELTYREKHDILLDRLEGLRYSPEALIERVKAFHVDGWCSPGNLEHDDGKYGVNNYLHAIRNLERHLEEHTKAVKARIQDLRDIYESSDD